MNMNFSLAYAMVDGFSIAFLLILFISTREKSTRLTDTRCFRSIVVMTIAALACDMLAWQFDGRSEAAARYILWVSNIACYILSGLMTFSWLYYSGLKMNKLARISKAGWAIILMPLIVLCAVSLLTPWTHLMFNLNESNVYERGTLFSLQMIIPFGYLLAAALWSLNQARRERLRQQRMEYMYLSSFIVFPLIGGILQLSIYGISLAWPCTALALMQVYVTMQNQKISLDALTGLNNRGQFDKYLYNCIERAEGEMPFALFMLDIDEFKKINDLLGHTAGDAALIDASSVLKKALADTNSFLARYGGDEFAIVLYYKREEQLPTLIKRISEESERHNSEDALQYRLVFSVGYVVYDKHRYSNYQDMLIAADAQMYMQKRQHKAIRA